MNTNNPNPSASSSAPDYFPVRDRYRVCCCRSVSWPAVFAGMIVALAIQVLLMLLGAGLGFALYHPLTEASPVTDLGAGAMIIEGISAVISLWAGGWVAGRFTPAGIRVTGWLHGFSVWCAVVVAGVLFAAAGAGWALGDLSELVNGGLSFAGKPAAALAGGAADLARGAAKQSTDTLSSFVNEAVSSRPAGSAPNGAMAIRAKREVGFALARLFSLNPASQSDAAARRAAVAKALVDDTGMSEADANRMVADWTASYDQLKSDLTAATERAEAKARQAADEAAHALTIFSLCAFLAFVLGAIAASCGGHQGASCALKCEDRADRPAG